MLSVKDMNNRIENLYTVIDGSTYSVDHELEKKADRLFKPFVSRLWDMEDDDNIELDELNKIFNDCMSRWNG